MSTTIPQPGVEVIQEFVTASPTVVEPTLAAALVGPCFQIISAFDDDGEPLADALAGTYRDGNGVIAYALPSLLAQASLSGFEDDIRVFLVLGSDVTELRSESGETLVVEAGGGATATYTPATGALVDTAATFLQSGVEIGDVLRVTYKGVEIDIPVTAAADDQNLTLDTSFIPAAEPAINPFDYDIVREPAQFIFDATAQAFLQYGLEADYIQWDVKATSGYAGSLGDNLSLEIVESQSYASGTSSAGVGENIFVDEAVDQSWLTTIGPRGPVAGKLLLVDPTLTAPGLGDTNAFRDILAVVDDATLLIEGGVGVSATGEDYLFGDELTEGATGSVSGTTPLGVFDDLNADFVTDIQAVGVIVGNPVYIELSSGVYAVTEVVTATQIKYTSTAASDALTPSNGSLAYVILRETLASVADGGTGALTDFASYTGNFLSIPTPLSKLLNTDVGSGAEAVAITTVTDDYHLVVGALTGSAVLASYTSVDATALLTLSFDPDTEKITVQLARAAGISSSTMLEVVEAFTLIADPSFNQDVFDLVNTTNSAAGATAITQAGLPFDENFDGGADEDQLILDADLIGSLTPTGFIYVSYKALRLDVSDQATESNLLSFENTTEMAAAIGPISVDNPLALAFFYALANSPGHPVKGIGVSEVNAAKPDGTAEAYVSAFEFLEGHEVYVIVPLTQDPTVHQFLQSHVNSMSAPENKSERIAFINQAMPLFEKAEVIAAGTGGNTGTVVGSSPAEFMTSVDFAIALALPGDILVVSALAGPDDSPDGVDGTSGPLYGVTITGIKSGDDFTLEFDGTATGISTDWDSLIDVNWTLYRPGPAISAAVDQAEQIALIGEGFADRRVFHHCPDQVVADIEGTAFLIDGFYAAAAWAGLIGELDPDQGFTNLSVAGFTGVKHSNGYFSRSQLDRMAGGGTFINFQESQSAPLKCRHQLATDTSTTQKRELSITKVIDYVAKYLRQALSKKIGKFNITQSFLDSLATSLQGLLRSLVEGGVLNGASLLGIEVDDVEPDKINITVLLDVAFPVNRIAITLQV
jgi:hypothetical protein